MSRMIIHDTRKTPIYESVIKDLGDIPNATIEIKRSHSQMKHDRTKAWKITNEVWRRINGG